MSKSISQIDWLKERQKGIGGSDVAAILGMSPWRTPYQVWEEKTTPIDETAEEDDRPALYWGRVLEAPIRQAYADKTGRTVTKPAEAFVSSKYPFMRANLDGIADDGRVVEFKTSSKSDGWGEVGTDEIPDYYMTQVQHYLAVTGVKTADVAVLIGGNDFRIYTVEADEELQALLIERESEFWALVESRTPPDLTSTKDAARRYRVATAKKAVEATTGDVVDAWTKLCAIKEQKSLLDAKEKTYQLRIMEFMQDAVSLKRDGKTIASWSAPSSRKTINSKKLKEEFLDVYKACTTESAPSRAFRIYPAKD